jgi:protein-S-isoprenylcysteine O-methyltransferase Ste14
MKASMSDRVSPDSINGDRAVNPGPGRIGGWLFRHRTSIPLPVAAAILFLRVGMAPPSAALAAAGIATTLAGETLRLWGVHHIGVISRTRSERLGPLISTGPFAIVRNPLYVGNIALWIGFALTARLVWLAPVILVVLGLEYHAIVRWEEQLLESRLGDAYRSYAATVNRWMPAVNRGDRRDRRPDNLLEKELSANSAASAVSPYSWRETLFSERGTLIAIAAGYLLLWLEAQLLT